MTTTTKTFNDNIKRLSNLGFNLDQSLSIIKRFNMHISFGVDNNQDYEETLFYIKQDFSFDDMTTEAIMIDCMLSDEKFTEYYK